MIKLRSKRFSRSSSKLGGAVTGNSIKGGEKGCGGMSEIKWELRPGGMLVQKRDTGESAGEGAITVRVSTVSKWHDISIEATSTFGKPFSKALELFQYGSNFFITICKSLLL